MKFSIEVVEPLNDFHEFGSLAERVRNAAKTGELIMFVFLKLAM